MPSPILKNQGIAIENTPPEKLSPSANRLGQAGADGLLMAQFSQLLDKISVELEKTTDFNTLLANQTSTLANSKNSAQEEESARFQQQQSEVNTFTAVKSESVKSSVKHSDNSAQENSTQENSNRTSCEQDASTVDKTETVDVAEQGNSEAKEDANHEAPSEEILIETPIPASSEKSEDTEGAILAAGVQLTAATSNEVVIDETPQLPVSQGLPSQTKIHESPAVQENAAVQDGLVESRFQPGVKVITGEPSGGAPTQSENPQGTPLIPEFQSVTGEELQVVKEVTSAIQQTALNQQVQQGQPRGEDQLAKLVEGLLQGKNGEEAGAQQVILSPTFKPQSELFSSLVQSRILSNPSEASVLRGVEQMSSFTNSGAQQGHSQTLNGQAHGSVINLKADKSEAAANKESMKELSKGQELRTLKKVEEALRDVAKSRDGKSISLRLDPPSLGSVRVEVSIRDGVLHARLAADNAHVNTLLRDKGAELQQVLRGLGLDVNNVNVSVQDDGSQQNANADTFSQQQEQFERESRGETDGFSANDSVAVVGEQKSSQISDHWVA